MTRKVTVTFLVGLTYFMTLKCISILRGLRNPLYDPIGPVDLCGRFDLVYDPKVTGSLEVAVTYFMTHKATVTLLFGLTYCLTPKGHRVIKGRQDKFFDPKGRFFVFFFC